jgi:hypothetical protein
MMNANGEGFQGQPRPPQNPADSEGMMDGEGDQPEEAQVVRVQPAPPPQPPMPDEDQLPPFITGRPE